MWQYPFSRNHYKRNLKFLLHFKLEAATLNYSIMKTTMRRSNLSAKLLLLTILFVGFIGFIFVRYIFLDNQKSEGEISILSSPKTSIFIDNQALGKPTPYKQKIKVGEYLIKLIPQEATATASWQGKVRVYKGALTFINRELGSTDVTSSGEVFTITKMEKSPKGNMGEILVETDPTGAIVYVDNDEKGVAPLLLSDVPAGTHELSVFLPGFFRRTQKVNVTKGNRVNAEFKLAIDQSQKRVELPKKEASQSAQTKTTFKIKVSETGTGFLRVRSEPSISSSESAQVKPGDEFTVLEEKNSWYRIEYSNNKEGWISAEYTEKI